MKRVALVWLLVAGAGCTDREPASSRPVTRLTDPADVIDQDLMVALAQAKNYHHKAKVYRSDAKLPEAIAAVREILSLRFPANAPEAEDVRNDARALLAKLLVEQGQLDEAMRTVAEGLAQRTRDSFFVANLYTVQGEIHEARAALLAEAPTPAPDAAATILAERHAAIEAFDRSIQINSVLQKSFSEDR